MADETPQETDSDAAEATPAAEAASSAHAPAATKASAREDRALRDHQERSQRPSRTAEERDAERRALRKAKAAARTRRRAQEKAKKASDEKGTGTPPAPPKDSSPQVRTGTVVSAKPDKTIVVRIDIARRHRRYEKIVRSTTKLHAHDETNDAREGDLVRVSESRPLSRTKRWKLEEVLERAK
jgi:small subunit ribosomal protein S17